MIKKINSYWMYVFFLFIAAILVYLPGLPGGFIYDDYFNFLQNSTIDKSELSFSAAWTASQSGLSGPLGRPFAMLSFYLNYQLTGFHPLSFKLINIVIHALNTLLVFAIVNQLLILLSINRGGALNKNQVQHLAFWITILWAVHPIHLTAVLYIVQRMTSMAAMFTLLGIYHYLILRQTPTQNINQTIIRLASIAMLGVIAGLCKENGLLLFLFLFVIESFLFRWRVNTSQERWCLYIFYCVVLVLPLCLVVFMLFNGDLTENYSGRAFDLTERMLTECRVLWFYISQILLPQANVFGLYHDDFVLSTGILKPISTLSSIAAFVLLALFAIKYNKKHVWFGFGLSFFIAGHVMESTILPLNLVHEHRNYLPALGLLIIFVLSLNLIMSKVKIFSNNCFFVVIAILFTFITVNRAYDWSNVILLGERMAQRHPNSITANYEMGYAYTKVFQQTNEAFFAYKAITALQRATSLSNDNLQPAIALLHVRAMLGESEDLTLTKKVSMEFKTKKVTVPEVISLRQYLNCYIEGICKSGSQQGMENMFNSLMTNSSLQGRLKDDVLYIYSTYLLVTPGGHDKALTIMEDVASRNPNVLEYQVKLISILLTNGKSDEANSLMQLLTNRFGLKWEVVQE